MSSVKVFGPDKTTVVYMLADATDPNIIHYFNSRLDKLGIDVRDRQNIQPHISLMVLHLNKMHPGYHALIDNNGKVQQPLIDIMHAQYANLNRRMLITSRKGAYKLMGEFMAKVYTANNSDHITQFRMGFYDYLGKYFGRYTRRTIDVSDNTFHVYSYGGKDLIAVPDYYHGQGVWNPHLSLVKLDKIQRSIYHAYRDHNSDINVLINALAGSKGSLDNLNMSHHFGSLRITAK